MNENTLLKYLDDSLSESERVKFELELNRDPDLMFRLERLRLKNEKLRELSNVKPNSGYFNGLEKKVSLVSEKRNKKSWVPLYAISFSLTILIVIFLVFNPFEKVVKSQFELTDSEISTIDDNFNSYEEISTGESILNLSNSLLNIEFDFSELQDYYYEELESDSLVSNYAYSTNSYSGYTSESFYNTLTDEEFDDVLKELGNKKIL